MNTQRRSLFQTILWLIVWIIIGIGKLNPVYFLLNNSVAFIFQCTLIAGVIFYGAKMLLFNKKYFQFLFIALVSIILASFISSRMEIFPEPSHSPKEQLSKVNSEEFSNAQDFKVENEFLRHPQPRRMPSKFFIQFLFISISFILATFIETFVFALSKEKESVENKNENLQIELKLLKSQINPHFLFNTLNNIYALSIIDSNKTQQSILYLSNMFRYVLYDCDQPLVLIQKEVDYLENYIKLFSLKSSKSYAITTNFNISNKNILIAPMLFIPFIENAIKHCNIEKTEGAFINLKMDANEEVIHFEIENSIAKKNIIKDKVGGINLENISKRLSILYPNKHTLIINESNGVYKVALNIRNHV